MHSVHLLLSFEGGGERYEPPTKFSKKGGSLIGSVFRGDAGKKEVTFFFLEGGGLYPNAQFTDLRGGGLTKMRVVVFLRGVDTPMHTM